MIQRSNYQSRKRSDIIGPSKVLSQAEQRRIFAYLNGQAPSEKTGLLFDDKAVAGQRLSVIVRLFLVTGLRETELASLRVKDTPWVLGAPAIEVYRGKGNKDRVIPVSEKVIKMIDRYIQLVRLLTLPRWVKRDDVDKCLFYSKIKKPYTRMVTAVDKRGRKHRRKRTSPALYWQIRRLGEHAGLKKRIYPHMLRHTFAVNSLREGVTIDQLAYLMGHSSILITHRYLHFIEAEKTGVADRIYQAYRNVETTPEQRQKHPIVQVV